MEHINSLKQIIESFENKRLYSYRFDKGAIKKETNCANCIFFKDNFCSFLKDKVDPKYTCNNFIKRDQNGQKKD